MIPVREKFENGFGWWARRIHRHRWLVIGLMLAATAALATRLPHLEVETSSEDYLLEGDPARVAYDAFRAQFGRDQSIYVVVEPESVFDLAFLDWLRGLHHALEEGVPHLDEVESLVNARSVHGVGDRLFVDELMAEGPTNEAELAAFRERVLSTPAYQNGLISADGAVTTLLVRSFAYSDDAAPGGLLDGFEEASVPLERRRFLNARETNAFSDAVLEIVERHRREGVVVHATGQPLVAYALTRSMARDVPVIFGMALLTVALMIVGLFQRFAPVLLASSVVVLSLVATLGVAQLLGFPISLPTQILPSFLLAVGVGYVVHVLVIFDEALATEPDRAQALERTLREVGPPILMTAATTMAGLLSFLAASMEQALQLGITGAIGIATLVVYGLAFLPAVLTLLPARAIRRRWKTSPFAGLLEGCARLSIRHPRKVVAATALLAIGAVALLPRLDHSADPMNYFPEDHWLRQATFFADERLGGMQSLEVVVDTGRDRGLHDPAVLARLEALDALWATLAAEGERVTRGWSMLDILKETNQALNGNDPAAYRVPDDAALIPQELLLFENSGSDDLERWVDPGFRVARMSVLAGWEDGVEKHRFVERVRPRIEAALGDAGDPTLTGAVVMIARTASASLESLIRSYSLALLLITPFMMLVIGSLRAGLVSMVPNLVPIGAALASMVVVGIELDMFTILGACIAIGLAVDDSIHFIAGFRRRFERTGDAEQAIIETMHTTGRALLFTSLVLVAGFSMFGFSSMANLGWLGLTTAFAIALAFVLDVTATPALLWLTHAEPGRRRGERVHAPTLPSRLPAPDPRPA